MFKKLRNKFNLICLFIGIGALSTISRNERYLLAANSATGEIFNNEIIRTFYGQRLSVDQEYSSVQTFTEACKRWGVVTTIFDPNEAILRVADMSSWCLVIVPDLKTPDDYMDKLKKLQDMHHGEGKELNNVFYFSIEKQKEWGDINGPFGLFVRSTPWKHFCRKNIGYLFAILHGAEYIFDFDDDNYIKVDNDELPLPLLPTAQDPNAGLVLKDVNVIMQGANAFNHHPIMGASVSESWARGFPLELIQDKSTQGEVAYGTDLPFVTDHKEIGVIQFLADGNPDIDAMHRISKPLPMTFPLDNAKSVLVPTHAYAPYNAQATIHTKNAFFATLLPGTVPGRVSDIWRSYFAQCIFHDAGIQLVFSPPKIVQHRNEHNALGDFDAEQDLYGKSGKLVEFLSEWDSDDDTVPKRMEKLWIDLYERGYIEIDDVYAVQLWLGALHQAGYEFPKLKRRFRNVAVMGQFNYADSPTVVDDVTFWTQKQRERFTTVVAAGPFSKEQMDMFNDRSIAATSHHSALEEEVSESDHRGGKKIGFYAPLENNMKALLAFKDHPLIEGVLYAHDDSLLNVTELSQGEYPFPSDEIIASEHERMGMAYGNVRKLENVDIIDMFAYRIFPDGHLENFKRDASYENIDQLYRSKLHYTRWPHTPMSFCGGGQIEMAKDVESASPYLEDDGSLLFSPFVQADFLYVPTKYADEFAKAAQFHLKHGVFIECAYGTIVDMVRRKTDASVRVAKLCTDFDPEIRGTPEFLQNCRSTEQSEAVIHPIKISGGYGYYGWAVDSIQ